MSASSRIFNPQGKFCSKRFFSKLKHWMEHHPVASNSVLCLNLWVAGDVLAQYSEQKLLHQHHVEANKQLLLNKQQQQQAMDNGYSASQEDATSATLAVATNDNEEEEHGIDLMRVATSAGYGAFVYGPILAIWYPYLDRMCKAYKIAARFGLWGAPIAKVIADELIMSPPCIFLFFGYMTACERGTMQTFQNKLQGEFFSSWMASITFWPPISLATFRFLPVYAQAPVINAVCILWDAFLSHRNAVANINEKIAKQKQIDETAAVPKHVVLIPAKTSQSHAVAEPAVAVPAT